MKRDDLIQLGNRKAVIVKFTGRDSAKVVYISDKNEAIVDDARLVDDAWVLVHTSPLSGDRVLGKKQYQSAEALLRNPARWPDKEREQQNAGRKQR